MLQGSRFRVQVLGCGAEGRCRIELAGFWGFKVRICFKPKLLKELQEIGSSSGMFRNS